MRVAVASDHAGFVYKQRIAGLLRADGHVVVDFGTDSDAPCDYPDFIRPAAEAVARGEVDRAVVLGGSGNGEAITANRIRGVRCALCWDMQTAEWSRAHNDANMLAIGARTVSEGEAVEIFRMWMTTGFDGGRHVARIRKIEP